MSVTAGEFDQQATQMLEAAQQGSVWGKVVGVLSSYDAYQHQQGQKGKALAESFSGQHSAADLDDAFDAELAAIRQQSREGHRMLDWE